MLTTAEIFYKEWRVKKLIPKDEMYSLFNKILRVQSNYIKSISLSPLMIEVLMGNKDEVNSLIDEGTDVNEVNEEGMTPLAEAVIFNDYNMAKLLLERGASTKSLGNYIPLHQAALNGNERIIKLLIDYGANPNELDLNGFNAFHYLLHTGSFPVKNSDSILYHVRFFRRFKNFRSGKHLIDSIDELSKAGTDINHKAPVKLFGVDDIVLANPLSFALEDYNSNVVSKLIDCGADREAVELDPSNVYAYQDSFSFLEDIKDMDLSCWPDAPGEYIKYLNYKNTIRRHNIDVVSYYKNRDEYKRPKLIRAIK